MTIDEAIKICNTMIFAASLSNPQGTPLSMTKEELTEAMGMAIKALEEVQQYRQICTVDECRAWKEKHNAKKVISFDYNNGTVNYRCPVCKRKIISKIDGEWCGGTFNEYCDRCGQKLDWSDEDGKNDLCG